MKLSALIKDCPLVPEEQLVRLAGFDPEISHICSDSRQTEPGALFAAVKGYKTDGHAYIEQAFKKGAAAVIAEKIPTESKKSDQIFIVENSRIVTAYAASKFYREPSKHMTLIGITGTNGKTTTTWILENILKTAGFKTGVIGTVNIRFNGRVLENPVTTPDSIDLQRTLYEMKNAGVTHVIMEVSSHGLDLHRVDFCSFDAGIFTNLSQDHLDFHNSMDDYFSSKLRLFTEFICKTENSTAVLNMDDEKAREIDRLIQCRKIRVRSDSRTGSATADLLAKNVTSSISGISATIDAPGCSFNFTSCMIGHFNLENILCAAGAAFALGIRNEDILKGIETTQNVPGRLEKVELPPEYAGIRRNDNPGTGTEPDSYFFVDYAHTPDALESILDTLKPIAPKRIIIVFGCGGDRDRTKRPLMGQIACSKSDIAIISSDNPRSEAPELIIDHILAGVKQFKQLTGSELQSEACEKGYYIEADRRAAIETAVLISHPGDIVVVAGKGHETYQVTRNGTIHFDDREEIQKSLVKKYYPSHPIPWTVHEIQNALDRSPCPPDHRNRMLFSGVCTDSRAIKKDQVFVALKGDNFDGHDFIEDLILKGICCFIVSNDFLADDNRAVKHQADKNLVFFSVADTITALGQLARFQRERSRVRVAAITGSNGKTTTRKITHEIFKTRFNTLATKGNFNNEIGLPLTLLDLSYAHEWAVVEMGMNHAGEIARLSRIAVPDIALITNTAGVHLEGLGTVENVAHAKAEIFLGLGEGSTAVIPFDDPRKNILEKKARENKLIKTVTFFGQHKGAETCASHIELDRGFISFSVEMDGALHSFSISSPAPFMVNNCLAAICAAKAAGIPIEDMRRGISRFTPVKGRMNILKMGDMLNIIDDTYNANPASVENALQILSRIAEKKPGIKSIAVLGDMLELGKESDRLHWQLGKKAADLGIEKLFVFGEISRHTAEGAIDNGMPPENIFHGSKEEIIRKLLMETGQTDGRGHSDVRAEIWLLVKGSRGMTMEKVIHGLEQEISKKLEMADG